MPVPRITSIHPLRAVEGGAITIRGEELLAGASASLLPDITFGGVVPRISFTSVRDCSPGAGWALRRSNGGSTWRSFG